MRALVLSAILFAIAITGSAAQVNGEQCPWMNEATAAGALAGPVTATFAPVLGHQDLDGVCRFTRSGTLPAPELSIELITIANPKEFARYRDRCKAPIPVRAIGNEAFACSVNASDGAEHTWKIVGRVRTRVLILSLRLFDDKLRSEDRLESAKRMADIVAGNLY